jgi:hypothetical protein
MVLHDILSMRLSPLQDRPRPTWMCIGVNDIMRPDRGHGFSLDEDLLAASLRVLTADQFLAELMVPPAACKPICMNQAVRMAFLAAMPMLDDLSRNMLILEAGGLAGATGSCGRGGVPTGGRGGGPALAPDKGKEKQARVVLDDYEVSLDEDVPLQKRLRQLSAASGSSGSSPDVANVAAAMKVVADKEVTDKRAVEEATVKEVEDKEAADKRAAEEATTKEVAVGAARDSLAPARCLP